MSLRKSAAKFLGQRPRSRFDLSSRVNQRLPKVALEALAGVSLTGFYGYNARSEIRRNPNRLEINCLDADWVRIVL